MNTLLVICLNSQIVLGDNLSQIQPKPRTESRASCSTGKMRELELPAVSGSGFYNAISLTTVHTAEGTPGTTSLLDITHR